MEEIQMNKETLVFSIALNGYQWRYHSYLKSHLAFANKFGYHYQAVTKPFLSQLGIECCWLKLTLMHTALLAGYKYVIFLDADAFVQEGCPAVSTIAEEGKYLYMAKGYSKRFNSGVMIVKNNPRIREWLSNIISNRTAVIEPKNDVGWGENSHIIQYSHGCKFIKELPTHWNNTFDTNLNDFIRHQNFGPLRTGAFDNSLHKIMFAIANRTMRLHRLIRSFNNSKSAPDLLMQETKKVLALYPCFYKVPLTPRYIKTSNPLKEFKY